MNLLQEDGRLLKKTERTGKTTKIIRNIIWILVSLWLVMLGTDYWRTTHAFAKPVFALCTRGFDDGGSGTYTGIGYTIEIKGNFMPEDELPGVTQARFLLFGVSVSTAVRD
jgi:hypothetical protein